MLADANPREVFHAVTRDGVPEPPLLAAMFPEPALGQRGWFLDAIEGGRLIIPRTSCNSSTFRSHFQSWHSYINDVVYVDANTSPPGPRWSESDPFAAGGCAYSGHPCMYRWNRTNSYYTYSNVDRYKSRVHICQLQPRTTVCHQSVCYNDLGPYLTFSYRTGNNASTGIAFSENLDSKTATGRYAQGVGVVGRIWV